MFHFKKMLKSLSKGKIGKHSVKDSDLECLMEAYETALAKLKTEVTFLKKQKKHRRLSIHWSNVNISSILSIHVY